MRVSNNYLKLLPFIIIFVIIINIQSSITFKILLIGFSLLLFFVGIANFKLLTLIIISLIPIRSYLLIFGSVLNFEITLNRVLVLILFITFLIYKIKHIHTKRKLNSVIYMLLILMLLDLLGVIVGDGQFLPSLRKLISFVFEVFIISYIYYRTFEENELPNLVHAFSLGCIVMCISAISERLFEINFLLRFPALTDLYQTLQNKIITRADIIRARSSFRHPVYFSAFLPLSFFSSFYLMIIIKKKFLGIFLLTLSFLSAALSLTRTAIYSMAILIIPIIILMIRKKIYRRYLVFLFFGIISVFFILYIIFPLNLTTTSQLVSEPTSEIFEGANISSRIELITRGIPFILKQNPFGVGFDDEAIEKANQLSPDIADFYIGYGLRKGVIYILFFCFIFLIIIKKMLQKKDNTNLLLLFLFLSIIATYFSFADYWISFPAFLIFFLVYNK